jgi:putative transposase
MHCPAERYVTSTRPYNGLPELEYPFHDKTVAVTTCGRICFNRQKINLSPVFAGQSVGIKQVSEEIWLVTFMDYDLGYFDHETCRLEPLDNPFGARVLNPRPGTHAVVAVAKPLAKRASIEPKRASGFATRHQRQDATKVLPMSPV